MGTGRRSLCLRGGLSSPAPCAPDSSAVSARAGRCGCDMQFIGDLLLLEGFSGDPLITGVVFNEQYVNRLSRGHGRCLSQGPGEAGDAEAHATAQGGSIGPPLESGGRWAVGRDPLVSPASSYNWHHAPKAEWIPTPVRSSGEGPRRVLMVVDRSPNRCECPLRAPMRSGAEAASDPCCIFGQRSPSVRWTVVSRTIRKTVRVGLRRCSYP
jgi:hypothetical protein